MYIFAKKELTELQTTVLTVQEESCGFSLPSDEEGCYKRSSYEFSKESYKKALIDLENLGFKPLDDFNLDQEDKEKIIAEEVKKLQKVFQRVMKVSNQEAREKSWKENIFKNMKTNIKDLGTA